MMIGFTAKAAIVLACRFGWRCSLIALHRNPSALAIGQNISQRLLISLWNFLGVGARAMESAVQFFGVSVFFVDAPGMIGRCATFRTFSRLLPRVWMRSIPARFIMPRLSRRWRAWRREIGLGQPYQLIAELLAQHPGADFFDFALTKLTELERSERDADEPSHA
jgi:hypothetical protein